MAKVLNFSDGRRDYEINGVLVRFNPTDSNFIEKLYGAFSTLDSKQAEYQKKVDEIGLDGKKMFSYARKRDDEIRGMIDDLLGEGIADDIFGDMNTYAMADGLPVWCNLFFALADEVEEAFTTEQKKTDPRVKTYHDRYNTVMKKYGRKN